MLLRSLRLFVLSLLIASAVAAQTVSVSVALQRPDPGPAVAGTQLVFNIFANNEGPGDAANVVLDTAVPAGSTFVSLSIPAGWLCPTLPPAGGTGAIQCTTPLLVPSSDTFVLTIETPPSTPVGTTIQLDATISTTSSDPDQNDNHDTLTVPIVWQTNLAVAKNGPASAFAGAVLTYTIPVTNPGPSFAANLTMTDVLPPELTFVGASGSGWTCGNVSGTVTCTLPQLAITTSTITLQAQIAPSFAGGTIANSVSLTSTSDGSTRTANASTQVTTRADLAVTKSIAPPSPVAGQDFTYTITVTNNGPSDAASVVMTDTLPAQVQFVSVTPPAGWSCSGTTTVTCTIATLAPATPQQFTLTAHVPPATPLGTTISNTATVSSSTADNVPGNNTATATAATATPAKVSGTKSVSAGLKFETGSVTYTIVLTNSGSVAQGDNPGNELVDVLPSSLTLVSATATSGTAVATIGTNTVTWNGAIPGGGSVTITITATIHAGTAGTPISNSATINFDADGNGTNESTATAGPATFTPAPAAQIPVFSPLALLALALALAAVAAWSSRA